VTNIREKFLAAIKYVIWTVNIAIVGLVVFFLGYCPLTHIDKTVAEGTYEGFVMGDSMQTVFNKTSKYFENQKVLGTFSAQNHSFPGANNEIFKDYNGIQYNNGWFIDTWRRLDSHGDVQWREEFSFTPRDLTAMSFFEIWEIFSFDSRDNITFYFQKGKLIKLHRSRNMCTI
jgi:hypothetical protein